MDFIDWIVLALVQAFAEVLPIGSSAQIAVLNAWAGLISVGPIDAASTPALGLGVRIGLALGAAAYFWEDVGDMIGGLVRMAKGKRDPGARLAFQLFAATLPSIAFALAVDQVWGTAWQGPLVVAWATFVIGFLLFFFDRTCMTVKRVEHAGYSDALLLGIAQALALVPGVGRIAASAAMARMLGYERQDTARFSFLISIPVLIASCAWQIAQTLRAGESVPPIPTAIGFVLTFIVTLILLSMLMNWLRRRSFMPFAIYRMLIGINLLVIAYGVL